MSAKLVEEAEAHAGLLRAYGDVREQPTPSELWAGCKDAAPVLKRCAERIAFLEAERGAAPEMADLLRRAVRSVDNACDWLLPGIRATRSESPHVEDMRSDMDEARALLASLEVEPE